MPKPWTTAGLIALLALSLSSLGAVAQEPEVEIPDPGVPQIMTLTGQFVRIAYNNEGYIVLGYRMANRSVGQEWMLLEFGATIRQAGKNYVLKREHISIDTPDGKNIPLATNQEYRAANLRSLEYQAQFIRDPIDYFPPASRAPCTMQFFKDLSEAQAAWNQVELSQQAGCVGRLYFNVPGGIQYGQHWLNVRFEKGLVRAPFYIMTEEEEEKFGKEWQDIKKQVDAMFTLKTK
jgi:hypothetical protein